MFKTKVFARDAKSERLSNESLVKAIREVRKGLVDAELGGNLVKKRIAVGAKGKSGGLRSILVYKVSADKMFCVYLFAKHDAENITVKQLKELKLLAKCLLKMTEGEIRMALESGALQEVIQDEE